MLNIFKTLEKNKLIRTFDFEGESTRKHRRDLPANKTWYNSVYAFNKNTSRFLPAVHDHVFKLLKAYFNMTIKIEKKQQSRRYKVLRRWSGRRVWVSTPEIKHLSDKINITVYVYNKVYNHYKKKLNLFGFKFGPRVLPVKIRKNHKLKIVKQKNSQIVDDLKEKKNKDVLIKPVKILKKKENKKIRYIISRDGKHMKKFILNITAATARRESKPDKVKAKTAYKDLMYYPADETTYVRIIKRLKENKLDLMKDYILILSELIKGDNKDKLLECLTALKTERYNYLIKSFKKELMYLKFKQKMLFHEFKFNELYLIPLINLLQDIYKKKVEFNIVSLKYYFLSSSILSQIVVAKIKTKKNRGRPLRAVDTALVKVKTPVLSANKIQRLGKKFTGMQNVIFNKENSILNNFLKNNKISKQWSGEDIHKLVLRNLENKSIAGVFIKISGRLTKRYKAQRAVSKLRYVGTLKNVYSSYKGLSSSTLRGHENINVEKTVIHSKVKIGAFGLKGWVSSY